MFKQNSRSADDAEREFFYTLSMNLSQDLQAAVGPHPCNGDVIHILVAAHSRLMRTSLITFLRTIPAACVIDMVETTLRVREVTREQMPHVLILDVDLSENDCLDLVRDLSMQKSTLRTIVLSDTLPQQKLFAEAGASYTLLKGFLDQRLRDAVLNTVH